MESYVEAYHRYFDPLGPPPGSPRTCGRELPRAAAYRALMQLKQRYHGDKREPRGPGELPTSQPLFENDELLDRAELAALDWNHAHPDRKQGADVLLETREQANQLWRLWTQTRSSSHASRQQLSGHQPIQRRQNVGQPEKSTVAKAGGSTAVAPGATYNAASSVGGGGAPKDVQPQGGDQSTHQAPFMARDVRFDESRKEQEAQHKNTGWTRQHVAEQQEQGKGGLTGDQPVGKIDVNHL